MRSQQGWRSAEPCRTATTRCSPTTRSTLRGHAARASSTRRRRELLGRARERGRPSSTPAARSSFVDARRRTARSRRCPDALQDRRVEITGPTDRKMVINALNSGARGFMADFEDSNSPTWAQHGRGPGEPDRRDPRRRSSTTRTGKHYELDDDPATLLVRPRGCTCPSATCRSTASRSPARSWTSACTCSTTREALLERGAGPYLYLPKLESHLEARAVERRVRDRRGGARPRPRHDQGHRPDRDAAGRVRDGRDPLRAARPLAPG